MQQVKICPAAFAPVWKRAVPFPHGWAKLLDVAPGVAVCTQHVARPAHHQVGVSGLQRFRLTAFDYDSGLREQNF